jgi:hypothetical protein
MLVSSPTVAGSVTYATFHPPLKVYGATTITRVVFGAGGCTASGTGGNATKAPGFSLRTGIGQVRAEVTLVTCSSPLSASVAYEVTLGATGLRFSVPTNGTYAVNFRWIVSYSYNLSVVPHGAPGPNASLSAETYASAGAHLFDLNVSGWQRYVVYYGGPHYVASNGSFLATQKNVSFVFSLSKLRLVGGHVYSITTVFSSSVICVAVSAPAGSVLRSAEDLASADGFGARLTSVAVT